MKLRWKRIGFIVGSSWTACDDATVGAWTWLHYAELLARAQARSVAIAVSDDVAVAKSFELCGKYIDC